MVQIIRHGIGKDDHTNTTIRGLPRSDRECQLKFGFDNMITLRNYEILPKEKRKDILNNALEEIESYFSTLKWGYLFENKANFVTLTFLDIPQSELEDYSDSISEIITQIKDKIRNFKPIRYKGKNHQEGIQFHIRNCGFIPKEESVMTKNQNVITNHDKMSSQNRSKKEKMSSQNKNVITKPKKKDYIHLRISSSDKTMIQEKAKKEGYKSVSKYIIDVMTDKKNVITPQGTTTKDVMTDNEHDLLIELIKIFIDQDIVADLSDISIEILNKIMEEEDLD